MTFFVILKVRRGDPSHGDFFCNVEVRRGDPSHGDFFVMLK